MKRFLSVIALTCLLAVSTLAGDLATGGIAPPPPPGDGVTASSPSPGDVPTSGYVEQISDAALAALLTMLGAW